MTGGSLRELERSYLDLRWQFDPVAASQAGLTTHDDRLGSYNGETLRLHLAALKAMAAALEEVPVDDLAAEIDRTALLNEVRSTIRRFDKEQPHAHNPEFWLTHALMGLHVLLRPGDRDAAARASAIAARLEALPAFLTEATATLTETPRVFLETTLDMLPAGSALAREAAREAGRGMPAAAERLDAASAEATAALDAFGTELERRLDSAGAGFAVGEANFNFRLHYEHALLDTAPELWRYGHRLAEEIEADLVGRAGPFGAPWHDVVDRLRADTPTVAELVPAYAGALEEAKQFVLARDLAAIPAAPLVVVPTPDFLRPLMPFAAYDSPGPYGRDRTGWFYVTLPDAQLPADQQARMLRDHCRHEIAATALHEGYPGHHLQLVTAQALPGETRRTLWSPITVEGWALYCEDLMAEQGFYHTAEERLFQRLHLLWRAVRILLDVGLHTRGMTKVEAVDMLVQRLHVDRANAEAEVRRYCAMPSYNLCYAVGRRELLRLRADFQAAQGGAYSLRAFHDAVLSYGGLPISLMRWGLGLGE